MSEDSEFRQVTEYHKFVGLFVSEYAQLEHLLRFAITRMSGLSQPRYDAIVGFPRSGELRALAKKLADLEPLSDDARIAVNNAFAHLTDITHLRDRVVHFGGNAMGEDGVMLYAKDGNFFPERDQISQDNLWNAAQDLHYLKSILIFRLYGEYPQLDPGPQRPWLYKPLQQQNTRPKPDGREAPPPQRAS